MQLTGIILAGGKSSRMGQDKGLMLLKGKPMIQYAISTIKPLVNQIIIIANSKLYEQFGHPVYQDLVAEKGPLGGIYTGLTKSSTNKNLVLSCDVPFVNRELLKLLIKKANDAEVIIPQKNDRIHPLIGIYNQSCLTTFENELEQNKLKLKWAIEKLKHKIVDANQFENKIFNNINYRDDITP